MHPLIRAYLDLLEEAPAFRKWRAYRDDAPMYYSGTWSARVEWYYEVLSCIL